MSNDPQTQLLDAILMHVPFDGWSQASFDAAVQDSDVDPIVARGLFPRGAVDLAVAYHKAGDAEMLRRIDADPMEGYRFRDKVAAAVRHRIEAVDDREVVRRGTTLFALPTHAADGAKLIWGTADAIWTALGDTSDDVNWYTKRATLSGVYSSTVLFWLGDDSPDHSATWEFLDRRIEDVMRFEKFMAAVNSNPLTKGLMAFPNAFLSRVKAPKTDPSDLPGHLG